MSSLVVMGVSGCGKTSVGQGIAQRSAVPFVEGDAFHPPSNLEKMRQGIPLTDADRSEWLSTLAHQLAASNAPMVLSCSALRRHYRERLRTAAPGLCFAFLDLEPAEALRRVAERHGGHPFPPSLVDSQFATLERPEGEPLVLRLDATRPVAELVEEAWAWWGKRR